MRFSLLAFVLIVVLYSDEANGSCQPNHVELGEKCFVFLPSAASNYADARTYCEAVDGQLAIINDCDLLGLVTKYIEENGLDVDYGYWLGATDAIIEGKWEWSDGSAVDMGAQYWARSQEDMVALPLPNQSELYPCLTMHNENNYLFSNWICDGTGGAASFCPLCERFNTVCTAPYVKVGSSCLLFEYEKSFKLWSDARTVCQSGGGDLAILKDCNMMTEVLDYIKRKHIGTFYGFWIGGNYHENQTEWRWLDNSVVPMGVPFWGTSGPGELVPDDTDRTQNCLAMDPSSRYRFNDVDCQRIRGMAPLCETPPAPELPCV